MAVETIKEINDPAFKTGVSAKTGKQWTLMQVTTDKNNLTTVFAPAQVGDKLELTWDAKYGSWKAEKVNAQQAGQLEALRKIYELNAAIYEAITGHKYGEMPVIQTEAPKPAPAAPKVEENPHIGDKDIADEVDNFDPSTIPF